MNPKPDISIIICTCNRAEYLRSTLAALAEVHVPSDMTAELLVVDNGSDATAEVAATCLLPNISARYIAEPRRGKGFAYNTGLANARGDILLFTDDDVRFPADWIAGLSAPILSGEAQAVQGGIQIAPHLQRDWMTPLHRCYFADTENWGKAGPKRLIGANMAFSREVLLQVPGFDEELGPGAMGFWEDSLFSQQLVAAGYTISPQLQASVEHHFDPTRLLREHVLQRAAKDGRSNAYVSYHWDHYEDPQVTQNLRRELLALKMGRLTQKGRWKYKEGASLWELGRIFKINYFQQFISEQQRPHNYTKQGLVKIKI